MNKPLLARGILAAALLAALGWGMWLVPLQPPHGHARQDADETWNLPPVMPPPNLKQLAQNVADRQGWKTDTQAKGGAGPGGRPGSASANAGAKGMAGGDILGISRVGTDAAILVAEGSNIRAYRPGDTLPDGRRILGIQGLHTRLAGPEGEQTIRLFPYASPNPRHD